MANSDTKRGLVPVRMASGSPYNGSCNEYHVAAANASPLFQGDPAVITGEADVNGVAGITRAAATGPITGVIVGFRPTATREVLNHIPANTEGYALVADERGLQCEIQTSAAIAAGDIGQNAAMLVVDGEPVYGRSQVQMDQGSLAATATLPLQLIGAMQREDNEPYTAFAKVLVRLNNDQTAGV